MLVSPEMLGLCCEYIIYIAYARITVGFRHIKADFKTAPLPSPISLFVEIYISEITIFPSRWVDLVVFVVCIGMDIAEHYSALDLRKYSIAKVFKQVKWNGFVCEVYIYVFSDVVDMSIRENA